jgi:hypothetical protein
MTKQDVISLFQNSIGSMFAKEDVLRILNQLEEPNVESNSSYPSKKWLNKIHCDILHRITLIDFNDTDLIEVENSKFSIKDGNKIELDSCDIDSCGLKRLVEEEIGNAFGEIEDEIIEIQQPTK